MSIMKCPHCGPIANVAETCAKIVETFRIRQATFGTTQECIAVNDVVKRAAFELRQYAKDLAKPENLGVNRGKEPA